MSPLAVFGAGPSRAWALVGCVLALALGLGWLMPRFPLLGLLLPVGLAVTAWFYFRNEIAIFLLQDALPLLIVPLGWFVTIPALPLSLPFIALWALNFAWRVLFARQRFHLGWGVCLNALFILVCLVSYLAVAEHTPYANNKIYLILTIDLFSFVAGATFVRAQFPRVFKAMIVVGLVVAGLTYYAYLMGTPTMAGRYSHLGQNPIWTGRLVFLGGFSALLLLREKRWGIAYLLAVLPAAVLSGSRGPLIGAFATGLILLAAHFWPASKPRSPQRAWRAAAVSLFIGLALSGVLGAAPPAGASETRELGDASTAHARGNLYGLAFQGFSENPLWGLGLGGFESMVNPLEVDEALPYPHNMALEVAAELGLVGLAAFAALSVYYLRLGWRFARQAREHPTDETARFGLVAASAFFIIFIASQFSGDLVTNHAIYFYMGLMNGIEALSRDPMEAAVPS